MHNTFATYLTDINTVVLPIQLMFGQHYALSRDLKTQLLSKTKALFPNINL